MVEDITKEMEKGQPSPQLFEKAQKAVFMMMEQDGWFRWVQTDSYKNFIESTCGVMGMLITDTQSFL